MSANCEYSKKYLPLVKAKQLEFGEDTAGFKQYLIDHFKDGEYVYKTFASGAVPSPTSSSSSNPPVENVTGRGRTIGEDESSINSFYLTDDGSKRMMERQFKMQIVSRSVLKIDFQEGTWEPVDAKNLAENLFQYKRELLETLTGVSNTYSMSNISAEDFQKIINDECAKIRTKNDIGEYISNDVWDAYVILSQFDKILEQLTPFVMIKKGYEDIDSYDKYQYVGPKAKMFTHFTSGKNADFAASEEQVSDLAQILLDIIPEYDENYGILENTGIGLSGFDASMTSLKMSILDGTLLKAVEDYPGLSKESPEYEYVSGLIDSYNDGLNIKLGELIDAYVKYIGSKTFDAGDQHRTYLLSKLKGINHFICDQKTPKEIQNIFYEMFFKTEPITYRGYRKQRGDNDVFLGKSLSVNFVDAQSFFLQDLVNGAITKLRNSKDSVDFLKEKYNVDCSKSGVINFRHSDTGKELTIRCSYKNNKLGVYVDNGYDDRLLNDLILDVLSYIVPDTYETCAPLAQNQTRGTDFANLLAVVFLANNEAFGAKSRISLDQNQYGQYTLKEISDKKAEIASRLSIIYGSETKNVVKSYTGSKLPLYQLTCLNYNAKSMMRDLQKNGGDRFCYRDNLLIKHPKLLGRAQVRSDVVLNGVEKDVSKLTTRELLQISIFDDFKTPLESGKIYLQNATFADKGTHFLQEYNVNEEIPVELTNNLAYFLKKHNITTEAHIGDTISVRLGTLIENIVNAGSIKEMEDASEILSEVTRSLRARKINTIVNNILRDYEAVFGETLLYNDAKLSVSQKLEAIDNFLKDKNEQFLQKAFEEYNEDPSHEEIVLKEEIHYYKPKNKSLGKVRFNETLLNWHKTFNNKSLWEKRIKENRARFVESFVGKDNTSDVLTINKYQDKRVDMWIPKGKDFADMYDSLSGDLRLVKRDGKMLPVVEAYFMSDILLSNEFNSLTIGEVYAHPNKNKDLGEPDTEEYYEFSEANRLIAQIKRSVIFGATIHPFAQNVYDDDGVNRGVAERINIAVIEDIPAGVWNISGLEKLDLESMDGSGFALSIQSRLENNSLLDAAVGTTNKKTILGDVDPVYGCPTLLKWAVYTLTNEMRRNGTMSTASVENLVRRMMSVDLDASGLDFQQIYETYGDKIVFKNYKTGVYYKIDHFEKNQDGSWTSFVTYLDSKGNEDTDQEPVAYETYNPKTLYEIDQMFGGAWTGKFNGNTFVYGDANDDIMEQIVCKNNLKDKFIAYAVNKTAIKVGASNVNKASAWRDHSKLKTFSISTKYGGVQMDADHDLDLSEVTEMTQMISALSEDGHYPGIVNAIYGDIGQILEEKLRGFIAEVHDPNKKQELYVRLAKSLMESFETGSKSTIGLAQAFLKKASRSLKEGDFNFKIPFSSATISGAFIADVAATINKKGIRHKYEGFAGVLNPSYHMVQYYAPRFLTEDGKVYTKAMLFDEMADECRARNWDVENLMKLTDGERINPFAVEIENVNDIKFEDTLVLVGSNGQESKPFIINSFYLYDKVVNRNAYKNSRIYKLTCAPRNLSQGYTSFKVGGSDKEFNLYNLDTVRAAYYLGKKNQETLAEAGEDVASLVNWTNEVVRKNGSFRGSLDEQRLQVAALTADQKIKLLNDATQDITRRFDYAIKERETGKITERSSFIPSETFGLGPGVNVVKITDYWTTPHEIITGRYQWEKLGIDPSDKMDTILTEKSRFFERKLNEKRNLPNIVGQNTDSLYDIVLYNGDKKVLVKIGQVPDGFKLTSNPDFVVNHKRTGIDDDVLYNGEYICKSEGKAFYTYVDDNNVSHTIVVVDNKEAFDDLFDSGIFDDIYNIHYTEENKNNIAQVIDDFGINTALSAEELQKDFDKKRKKKIRLLAQERYEAFDQLRYYVGARIPTQAMQSFMPMKVVAVTDCKTNQIFVPRVQTWLQGSDYDIDKLYILIHSLDSNGRITCGSGLQRFVGLKIASKLVKPNGITYKVGENGLILTQDIGYLFQKVLDGEANSEDRTRFVNIVNNIFNSGYDEVAVENNIVYTELVVKMLNKHSLTNRRLVNSEMAIKNRVVDGTLNVVRSPQNQRVALMPIDMTEQQDAAAKSLLGNTEKHLTSDNPAAKFIMQEQNMVGKEVIGITAVSLKTFFALTSYYGGIVDQAIEAAKNNDTFEMYKQLNKLIINNETVITNLDLKRFMEDVTYESSVKLRNEPPLNIKFNPKTEVNNNLEDSIKLLIKRSNRTDAALTISGLLSAATDNAKELILAKINATPELVDIYTYLAMTGHTFAEIAKKMSSPAFNKLTELISLNIFDPSTYDYRVKDAIPFMMGTELLSSLNEKVVKTIATAHKNDLLKLKVLPEHTSKNGKKYYAIDLLSILNNQDALDIIIKDVRNNIHTSESAESREQKEIQRQEAASDNASVEFNDIFSLTYDQRVDLYHTLLKYRRRNNFVKNNGISGLSDIASILDGVKEMSTLGMSLGVNQGLKTDMFDQYSFVHRFNSAINMQVKNAMTEELKKSNVIDQGHLDQGFDLLTFLRDPEERAFWINAYGYLKTSFNILDVISTVPHFSRMFNMLEVIDTAYRQNSCKYRLTMDLANNIAGGKMVKRLEFKEIQNYVNEKMISKYLRESDLEFSLPLGLTYYTNLDVKDVVRVSGQRLKIKSIWDLASFKRLMEDHIIPTLKRNYPNNKFLSLLGFASDADTKNDGKRTYYKLPFNLSDVESSPNLEMLYNQCLKDFNAISLDSFDGHTIGDLFYLYNMIVNKDSFGGKSLTRLFESLVSSPNSTKIIDGYNNWLAEHDQNPELDQIDDTWYIELRDRIERSVPGTKIQGENELTIKNIEDYPLYLPYTWNIPRRTVIERGRKSDVEKLKALYKHRAIKLNGQDIVSELAVNMNNLYDPTRERTLVHLIDDSDFDLDSDSIVKDLPYAKQAASFIYEGEIYVNTDHAKWTTMMHELSHLVLASMKINALNGVDKDGIYYKLMNAVENSPQYNDFKQKYISQYGGNIVDGMGSDLTEEILCNLLENYLTNKTFDLKEDPLVENEQTVLNAIGQLFNADKTISLQDLMTDDLMFIIDKYSSGLFLTDSEQLDREHVVLTQKMRTLKSRLLNSTDEAKKLTYECK